MRENNIGDEQALYVLVHYMKKHPHKVEEDLARAYEVAFLEQPKVDMLDTAENFWISRLKTINIYKTFLPRYK